MYNFTNASGIRIRERFKDADEGDTYMIKGWGELIRPEDHIYHLGDVCMNRENHGAEGFVKLMQSLPGHKRLVLGNHDHLKMRWYIEAGFQKIRGSALVDGLLLTHYPVHESSIGPRAIGNVHGHTHDHPDIGPRYLNVSCERTNYEPIPIEEVKARLLAKVPAPSLDVNGHEMGGL